LVDGASDASSNNFDNDNENDYKSFWLLCLVCWTIHIHHDLIVLTNNILSNGNIHSDVGELQLNNDDWWWIDEHLTVFSLLYNGCYLTLLTDIASCHCGC
jgi:hypothetical protein